MVWAAAIGAGVSVVGGMMASSSNSKATKNAVAAQNFQTQAAFTTALAERELFQQATQRAETASREAIELQSQQTGSANELAQQYGGMARESYAGGIRAAGQQLDAYSDRSLRESNDSAARAQQIYRDRAAQGAIMLPRNRGLTQQQQIAREDLVRAGQAQVAASGLRGAGRGGVGVILDAVRRDAAAVAAQNDAADLQAMKDARLNTNEANSALAANIQGTGQANAQNILSVGNAQSNLTANGANYDANSIQNQGNQLQSNQLGLAASIGSIKTGQALQASQAAQANNQAANNAIQTAAASNVQAANTAAQGAAANTQVMQGVMGNIGSLASEAYKASMNGGSSSTTTNTKYKDSTGTGASKGFV